jgi:predicted nuclease of predicted toxin-antitoxin system
MVRLYANENFPIAAVHILRNFGYDVITTHEVGQSNLRIPDENVLIYAISEKRAVITVNRKDFIRLHRSNPDHFGIIVCTKNDDFENFAACIHKTLQKQGSDVSKQLIRVYRDG